MASRCSASDAGTGWPAPAYSTRLPGAWPPLGIPVVLRRAAVALALCCGLAGLVACGDPILRHGGYRYEGEILGKVDGHYVVARSGETFLVPAVETDIDHPGNVLAGVGTALTALGLIVAQGSGEGSAFLLVPGLSMAAVGYGIWGSSLASASKDLSRNTKYASLVQRKRSQEMPADPEFLPEDNDPVLGETQDEPTGPTQETVAAEPQENAAAEGRDAQRTSRRKIVRKETPPQQPPQAAKSAPAPRTGACRRLALSSTQSTPWREVAQQCVRVCQGANAECGDACLDTRLGAGRACSACVASAARCEIYACLTECTESDSACSLCFEKQCRTDFVECSGLDRW